ncbi:MAG: hypothetical protein JSR21_17350 [Proteobacteria bacterium]|nr:hypothetical protein [Pseudomonadota bacterium]
MSGRFPGKGGHEAPRRLRGVAAAVAAAVLLNACTEMQNVTGTQSCNDPFMTPAQRQLCLDSATYHQTVAGGAALGGLTGAGAGALACAASHSNVNPLICAAIGLGVGILAGGATGYAVAEKQQSARQNIRSLDAVTADIRQQNDTLRSQVAAAQTVTAEDRQKLVAIAAATRSGQISVNQANAARATIAADNRRLADIISQLEDKQRQYISAGQELNQTSPDYTAQLLQLQRQIAVLKQQKAALDQAMAASS